MISNSHNNKKFLILFMQAIVSFEKFFLKYMKYIIIVIYYDQNFHSARLVFFNIFLKIESFQSFIFREEKLNET